MTSISARVAFAGQKVSAKNTRTVARARATVVVRAEDTKVTTTTRPAGTTYFASEQSLSYLDGTLAGDFGFDPLGVSDPEGAGGFIDPSWLAYAEVIHARFAMLGAAGCIAPEILGKSGMIPSSTGLAWFQNGVVPPSGSFDYWADPFSLFWGQLVLMQFAELRRLGDYRNPGSLGKQYFLGMETALGGSGDPSYPGGQFFNMFNLGSENMDKMKLKEIKNGRLAMLAMLGYFIQALVTGKGPYENLLDHLGDATANNFLSNFGNIGGSF